VQNYSTWADLANSHKGQIFANSPFFKRSVFAKLGKQKVLYDNFMSVIYDKIKDIDEVQYNVEFLYKQEKTGDFIIETDEDEIQKDMDLLNKHFHGFIVCEPFCLKSIANTQFYEKRDLTGITVFTDLSTCPLSIENIDSDLHPQAYKYVLGKECFPEDLNGSYEGLPIVYDEFYKFD
jgi:hypothetical protein